MNTAESTIRQHTEKNTGMYMLLYALCVFLVLADICYSFVQHSREPLDGDMGESILPLEYIKPLYADPLGVKMLVCGPPHAAPNRFFSHYLMFCTYNSLPFILQKFTDPIHSVYYSNAICKTAMQTVLVLLLSGIVCGGFAIKQLKFVLSCLFFSALMQTRGFVRSIGLVDPCITYSFFYALPLIFLLLYLLPFIFKEFHGRNLINNRFIEVVYCMVFLFLTCFSGAINPGVALVAILVFLIRYCFQFFRNNPFSFIEFIRRMPSRYYLYLFPLGCLSLYSLFISSYNTMFMDMNTAFTVSQRYALLPKGFFEMFAAGKGGFSVLCAINIVNCVVLHFSHGVKSETVRSLFCWILCFAAIYMQLLPFGGYRPYRPAIIRYDSVLPISCLFMLFYVYSTFSILECCKAHSRAFRAYGGWTVIVILFFFGYDTLKLNRNAKEMDAMHEIQVSSSDTIQLNCKPTCIASWTIPESAAESEVAGKLLNLWRITDVEKRFYFKIK